jgi:hypothetical protein
MRLAGNGLFPSCEKPVSGFAGLEDDSGQSIALNKLSL